MQAELNLAGYKGADVPTIKYAQPEQLYRRSLAIREKSSGSDSPKIQENLICLAMMCLVQNKFDDAKPLLTRSFAIWEANTQQLSSGDYRPQPVCPVAALNNLGVTCFNKGKLAESERLFDEALKMDPKYALGYANRSIARRKLGNIQGAEEDSREAKRLVFNVAR